MHSTLTRTGAAALAGASLTLLPALPALAEPGGPGPTEVGIVLTHIYGVRNDCQKYGWGVLSGSNRRYRFGPGTRPGTKTAFGTAECSMSIGGTFHGVGVRYAKQSNTEHKFIMRGRGAVVRTTHWTTTP